QPGSGIAPMQMINTKLEVRIMVSPMRRVGLELALCPPGVSPPTNPHAVPLRRCIMRRRILGHGKPDKSALSLRSTPHALGSTRFTGANGTAGRFPGSARLSAREVTPKSARSGVRWAQVHDGRGVDTKGNYSQKRHTRARGKREDQV